MEVPIILIEILLLLKILCYVDSQFMPGMPSPMGGMQFPQMPQMSGMSQMSMNAGAPMHMPGMHGMPGMNGIPGMGMPMSIPMMPQPKMPVVVMPFNKHKNKEKRKSKHKNRKKRKHRLKKYFDATSSYSDEPSDSASGSGEMIDMSMRGRRRSSMRSFRNTRTSNRRQVLTPVISYVTKDGYVIYQKKIKKEKAKDWLNIGRRSNNHGGADSGEKMSSSEEVLRKVLQKSIKKIKNKRV